MSHSELTLRSNLLRFTGGVSHLDSLGLTVRGEHKSFGLTFRGERESLGLTLTSCKYT